MNPAAPELSKIPFLGGDQVTMVFNATISSTAVPNIGTPLKSALSKKFSPTPCATSAPGGVSWSTASDEI
jgi:hypothetical protein